MLELRRITKRFGSVLANDDVSLVVRPGTVHALVGENGAGKSTAMRVAYGLHAPDRGEVVIDGRTRALRSPQDAIALGVGMVHQHFMLIEPMTVAENVVLGAEPGGALALDHREAEAAVRGLADEIGLAIDPRAVVATLTVGEQQRVELLRALHRRARALILDEPTAVLTPPEVADLFRVLRLMRDQGAAIVLVTHKLDEVLALADEITVMRAGRVVATRGARDTDQAELAKLMVGRDVVQRLGKRAAQPGPAVLRVDRLSVHAADGSKRLDSLSLQVRAGEIVGVAGVEGNGQTELIEAIAGLIPAQRVSGTIELDGVDLAASTVRARRARGIAHIPEDRRSRGLLLDASLADNAILGRHREPPAVARPGGFLLSASGVAERTAKLLRDFDVRPTDPEVLARTLSGGNQQKLVVGRELEPRPRLLLVAQPTRGVDVGAIELIHRALLALRDEGCAILLASADLDECLTLSDRLVVMRRGAVAGELDPARCSREDVGMLMTGGRTRS